jgi:geranylgeranyl diphosphate synthase, type I
LDNINNFKVFLDSTALDIQKTSDSVLQPYEELFLDLPSSMLMLFHMFKDHCHGGKNLRGALVKLGYQLANSGYNHEILNVSTAYEIFHASILIHDDIIDKSDLRRNKPTIHKRLGANHYALSQAISLGDMGFFLASDILLNSNFDSEKKQYALGIFFKSTLYTSLGQLLDVELAQDDDDVENEKAIITSYKLKTSRYTIIAPLQIGAILAGATPKLLKSIDDFGTYLGIAFQITDDILGVFGNPSKSGKPNVSDIQEGKKTLLFYYAYRNASKAQRQIIQHIYSRNMIQSHDLIQIQDIFRSNGALSIAQENAVYYTSLAEKLIPDLAIHEVDIALLSDLVNFAVNRKL